MVRSLLHGATPTTVLHPTPEAAAIDYCGSLKAAGGRYTGDARFVNVSTSSTPAYKASCLRSPQEGVLQFWESDVRWDLPYSYQCKQGLFDENTKLCYGATDRGAQPASCSANGSEPPAFRLGQNEVGNPIDISTGQKLLREPDYLPVNGLGFTRLYTSAHLTANTFSPHWRHNYSHRLISTLDSDSTIQFTPDTWLRNPLTNEWHGLKNDARVTTGRRGSNAISLSAHDPVQPIPAQGDFLYLIREDGNHLFFRSTDRGLTWRTDSGVNYHVQGLNRDAAGHASQWQVTTPETSVEIYDAQTGRLESIQFRDGRKQTLIYSTELTPSDFAQSPGVLLQVRDNFGRSLQFRYRNHLLAKMIDPALQEFLYDYDDQHRLVSVTWPDGLKRFYHYDEAGFSPSQNATSANGYLTGISDEIASGNLIRMATYRYDADGMPISTEHGNGSNRYLSDYANHSVTDPLGTVRQYRFTRKDGMLLLSSVSKPGGAGCAASSSSLDYDNELNLISKTDFNGTVTRFDYYPQNLPRSSTEAFGTPQARTTTRQWHPVFRLPSKIAAPKLLTIHDYDVRGNLLSTTEQATLDETGAQGLNPTPTGPVRKTSYTYNSVGQMTSKTEWRDNLPLTTVYQYNELNGNLEQFTDPVGLITRFTDYNAHGDVTRIERPNGDVSRLEYYPRRWLYRQTDIRPDNSSETTTWEYDGRGLLAKLTRPNGGYHIYNYDDAGRLINIADNFDNSLDYTLDPMGNRLLEQVRDPAGNLLGQVRRSYDALNRLQQLTVGKNSAVQDTPSSTVIESLAPVARVGYPVKIRATVDGVAPGGEVVLMEGNRTLGIQFLQRGSTTFIVPNLPLGQHILTAFYSGDDKNHPSRASTIVQTIQNDVADQVELACPANSVIEGTLTCQTRIRTDARWAGRLSGQTVRLFEGNTELASTTLTGISDDPTTAQAEFTVRGLSLGQHTLQARYEGDAILVPGQSPVVGHTVQDHAPQITEFTFAGPVVTGMQYHIDISRANLDPDPDLVTADYTVAPNITSLSELAQQLANRLRANALGRYQIEANGPVIRVTGPRQQALRNGAVIFNLPDLGVGISQEALSPRPATRGSFSFRVERRGPRDTGPLVASLTLYRNFGTRRQISRHVSVSLDLLPRVHPSWGPYLGQEICLQLNTKYPDLSCSQGSSVGQYVIYTPPGEKNWIIEGHVSEINIEEKVYSMLYSTDSTPQSEVLEPQPQIIQVRLQGNPFPGVRYTISAGAESWQYTVGPNGATDDEILQGLLGQIRSSQYVGSIIEDEDFRTPSLLIKSVTPLQPFTFSKRVENVPFSVETRVIQEAR